VSRKTAPDAEPGEAPSYATPALALTGRMQASRPALGRRSHWTEAVA
jgi:hypothetical protein